MTAPVSSGFDHEMVIVGSGVAGIGAAIEFQRRGLTEFVILERAQEVGGTWRDNTYPGLTVDIPTLIYSYSYSQKPDWSSLWAPQPELLEYCRSCVEEHGLRSHLRFGAEVVEARFNEAVAGWRLSLGDGTTLTCRYLVNASGYLSTPKWPDLPGMDEFRGTKIHSAHWPDGLDLTGQRVAFIGTGATGIQLAPKLAGIVERLHVFQRTPIWLLPKPAMRLPRALQQTFARLPWTQRLARLLVSAFMDLVVFRRFTFYRQVAWLGWIAEWACRRQLRGQIDDADVRMRLTPRFAWGCKRPSFSSEYFPIFNQDNVELVTDPIAGMAPDGIVTADGTVREVDAVICATGFQPFEKAALPTYPVHGRDGEDLADFWDRERYQAFHGFAVHGYPNFFLMFGPYSVASSSYFGMVEVAARTIARCLVEARDRRAGTVEVDAASQADELARILRAKKRSIWAGSACEGSNTYYIDRFGDTPSFRPSSHPREWLTSRLLPMSHFRFEQAPDPALAPELGPTRTAGSV